MSDGAIDAQGSFTHDNNAAPDTSSIMKLFSLKGKTAIISGAGAGIGLQVAHAYAEAGANVAIWYNANKKAITRAEEIEAKYGVQCKAYQVDVTNEDAVENAVNQAIKDLGGRLDVFVANSGIPWTQGELLYGEVSHYRRVIATNLDGVFFCARSAGKHFKRQKFEGTDINGKKLENYTYGSFIATASMSGHIVNFPQLQAVYNSSKAAVIHLSKSLAVEWVKFARVNTISPAYINTEISDFVPKETKAIWKGKTPMGREGEAGELKGGFLYFACDASSYTTGADLIIDGGYCLP